MKHETIAIVGAGVSGLTCGVLLAESGASVTILAEESGRQTTSAAAGAIWYPYDVAPLGRVTAWALRTFEVLRSLTSNPTAGVAMIELRCFARSDQIVWPAWGETLGLRRLTSPDCEAQGFASGFSLVVPLIDTSDYLDWLTSRFTAAGGRVQAGVHLAQPEDVPSAYGLIINCAGFGARALVPDPEVEPHRGQVVIVDKGRLHHAIVCDDPPLMYAFPRGNDCVLGGTNECSADRNPRAAQTAAILEECARVLPAESFVVRAERVGLRPHRRNGVRLEREILRDGRAVIHNYGHGGCGFTLSWGCAEEVMSARSPGRN